MTSSFARVHETLHSQRNIKYCQPRVCGRSISFILTPIVLSRNVPSRPIMPRLTTILEYLLFAVPLYLFVASPLLKILAPSLFGSSGDINYQSFENTDSLVFPDTDLICPPHSYNVRVLSREPLVVYIDGFLSAKEAEHMVNAA
jgi:hypothetical protein